MTKSTKSLLRIVGAQINPTVGDISGNAEKIIAYAIKARDELHADIIVFPELVLTGYPPDDLLLRPELYERVTKALITIKERVRNIYLVLGYPEIGAKCKHEKEAVPRYSSASVIYNGKTIATYHKQKLPNYGVFDEKRYFIAGSKPCVCKIKGALIAFTICEDLWFPEAMKQAHKTGAQLMVSLNASPFDMHKPMQREQTISKRAREGKMPVLYVNCVGGQDELIFDGGSMLLNKRGEVIAHADFFIEGMVTADFNVKCCSKNKTHLSVATQSHLTGMLPSLANIEERIYQALVLGVRDYANKNHFPGAIISVSGGIDSALTLAIAVDALGKERVETIYMPSRYSSPLSEKIVRQQTQTLGVPLAIISIEPIFKEFLQSLEMELTKTPRSTGDVTTENVQARCRGTLLMAFSNRKNLLVLSTGNKSEMAVGYATLYGDMAGGFCVLKDVPKTLVYRLAEYRNKIVTANKRSRAKVIPTQVITRPPSAELAKRQKDSDTLPPYPVLDAILERYIEQDEALAAIVAAGFDEGVVKKVIAMVNRSEYKRRQAPPGIRITARAFGRDRRYPITSGF